MNDNDRFIGQLEAYLDDYDGETPLPMHVRDAIRTALPSTRQDRLGRVPRGLLTMFSNVSTPVRGGLLAAGLVVAVALGAAFMTGTSPNIGAVPTVSAPPSTSSASSTAPSPSASAAGAIPISQAAPAPCYEGATDRGCIAAGDYTLNTSTIPGPVTVTLPEGWFTFEPGAGAMGLLVDSGPDAPGGSGWGPLFASVKDVRRDPCAADGAVFAAADVDTPAEIAAAMATWPGFSVTEPEVITFAGASGVQFDVSANADLGECETPETWSTTSGTGIDAYPMAVDPPTSTQPATFRVLEVDGELLIIRTQATIDPSPFEVQQGVKPDPERHAADLVEMNAILDSITFGGPDAP